MRFSGTRAACFGLFLISSAVITAQDVPGSASVSGRVIDGVSGAPLDSATIVGGRISVWSTGEIKGTNTTTTDPSGAFVLSGLPAGRLLAFVTKAGYVTGDLGQSGEGDASLFSASALRPGERKTGFVVKLWPEASISGTVQGPGGDPLIDAEVQRFRRSYVGGVLTWAPDGFRVKTDNRGRFQFVGLASGEYLVAAPEPRLASGATQPTHSTLFYPGAHRASGGTVIRLATGESRTGIDFTVDPHESRLSIDGRLAGGAAVQSVVVKLIPEDATYALSRIESHTTKSDDTGRFRFVGVPPGRYRILVVAFPNAFSLAPRGDAVPPLPDGPTWWANVPVNIEDQSIRDLTVTLQTGVRISGRVEFEGASAKPTAEQLMATPVIFGATGFDLGAIPRSRIEADGRFTSIGLPEGVYTIGIVSRDMGWGHFSIRLDGREQASTPIEVGRSPVTGLVLAMTDRRSTVSGTVRDAQGRATPSARVIIFPRDETLWRNYFPLPSPRLIKKLPVSELRRFEDLMVPGDYLVTAITSVPEFWMTPDFLRTLAPTATRVQLALGETRQVDLQVKSTP